MLSRLDEIIYPNRCEVIELVPSQRYFYPIYKNGSTSVSKHARQHNCKILLNQQLSKLDTIDIVLRDPIVRIVSGIQTFVYNTKRDNPTLDLNTIQWFATQYQFLNRHYATQLSWLINLNRYTKAKLRFYGMDEISNITGLNILVPKDNSTVDLSIDFEMYIRLDNLLMDLIGKELTFDEVLAYLKQQDKIAFQKLKCIALD